MPEGVHGKPSMSLPNGTLKGESPSIGRRGRTTICSALAISHRCGIASPAPGPCPGSGQLGSGNAVRNTGVQRDIGKLLAHPGLDMGRDRSLPRPDIRAIASGGPPAVS